MKVLLALMGCMAVVGALVALLAVADATAARRWYD